MWVGGGVAGGCEVEVFELLDGVVDVVGGEASVGDEVVFPQAVFTQRAGSALPTGVGELQHVVASLNQGAAVDAAGDRLHANTKQFIFNGEKKKSNYELI